ncbi:ABC-type transport auxiliary lipoprotein family protein [Desulfosoma caldarium]|uniref:Putative lipoprotein YmbA n=1 Tax=Desulfosoma caldarium TaxID=610254 RepID=A0A3N1V1X4_9BACT|nr:ABC-type transport auxiliary lipoprotein family protein [Desulfosoma caldarium]ROQ93506.1 putative lipoprotein YmbA [Desulfosoma caldarium]
MKMKFFFGLLVMMAFAAAGCGALLPTATPPVYYQVQAPDASSWGCASSKPEPLRVWALDGAAPYDRNELVLVTGDHALQLSSRYRWISTPGEMLGQAIVETASQVRAFSVVNVPGSPGFLPELHLGGRIREFNFQLSPGRAEAVLDVRIIVWREANPKKLVFQKTYRATETVVQETSPEELTRAMNRVVARWMQELMNDLCQASFDTAS